MGKRKDYKKVTQEAYDSYASAFDCKFEKYFQQYGKECAAQFISYLKGRKLLDAGSGPGNHALYFQKQGLDVLCIDNSPQMVKLCKEKGLQAELMDIEHITLPSHSFDGIWAYGSLFHLRKHVMPKVIVSFAQLLKPEGMLGIALIEGRGERFETRSEYPMTRRWFSYFTDAEIVELHKQYFSLVCSERSLSQGNNRKHIFLRYFLRLAAQNAA